MVRKGKDGKDIWKATGETCRLVHDGSRVIAMIEGEAMDVTTSAHTVFIGIKEACEAEIKWLKLTIKIEK